jgi:hypothetical protein
MAPRLATLAFLACKSFPERPHVPIAACKWVYPFASLPFLQSHYLLLIEWRINFLGWHTRWLVGVLSFQASIAVNIIPPTGPKVALRPVLWQPGQWPHARRDAMLEIVDHYDPPIC